MPYATLTDLETRYPGWLAMAGPKTAGVLDTVAVGIALTAADDPIDRALRTIGWTVPLTAPAPGWVVDLAVDIAAYLASTTAVASADMLDDRRKRYEDALAVLDKIASGKLIPPPLTTSTVGSGVFVSSRPRQFGAGIL